MVLNLFKKMFGGEDAGDRTTAAAQGNADPVRFVELVIRNLVGEPDAVKVDVTEKGDQLDLLVACQKSDMGRVIGKRGRTISAIRTLATDAAGRAGKKISVELED
jgi:predicted RNA-binding protein YlqC (UPF0109 family)